MARQKPKKKKQANIPPTKSNIDVQIREAVAPDGMDEAGHVLVVTQFGLAMLVAGLRTIKDESPEVVPLLETLEDALREGMEDRMKESVDVPT